MILYYHEYNIIYYIIMKKDSINEINKKYEK